MDTYPEHENFPILEGSPDEPRITLIGGFASEDQAETLGHKIAAVIHQIRKIFNLERLDGITVAFDYETALQSIERGFQPVQKLAPSREYAFGIAMTVSVLRNGIVKAHPVFYAGVLLPLLNSAEEEQPFLTALYMLVHELAHVHDLYMKDIAFPGIILKETITDPLDGLIFPIADACWDEYVASRLSAFIFPEQTAPYGDVFREALRNVREKVNKEITQYRLHGDITRTLTFASQQYTALLTYASYLCWR